MTTYHTMNPVGSADPRDLYDNAENLDVLVNSKDKVSYKDRLGVERKSWHGMEEDFQTFLLESGYQDLGTYQAGLNITARNQIFERNGEYYRAAASLSLPYVTTGDWTTEGSKFVSLGDAVLRQDLLNDGGDIVHVTTSTGSQTLAEALNSRVIFKTTKADLDAIPASNLNDGQEAIVLGTPFVWDASDEEWIAQGPINVQMYGATGDGVTDDGEAVKQAVESLREGETLYFPPGHYYTSYGDHDLQSDWIQIPTNGLTLTCTPGTVTLENFLILAAGVFETPINIGSAGFTDGDNIISTASDHGFQAGDVIQILSQRNAYTTDGLQLQLGSRNPTNLTTPNCRFSEIHVVKDTPSTTEIELESMVLYPSYEDNTNSLGFPISGVNSAQVRRISMVEGLTIKNLKFVNNSVSSYHCIYLHGSKDVLLKSLVFSSNELPGQMLRTENSINLNIVDVSTSQKVENASGSSWNIIKIAGGSQNVNISRLTCKGGHQPLDVTPATNSTSVVSTFGDTNSEYLTVQLINVNDGLYENNQVGFTIHPGVYLAKIIGNEFIDCSIGLLIRSRKNIINSNRFLTARIGCQLSAFYEDTIIIGNMFEKTPSSIDSGNWIGVQVAPLTSEIMNNNDIQSFLVSSNIFNGNGAPTDYAIQLRNINDGVPPNAGFTEYNDEIKESLSNYIFSGNSMYACGIAVNRFINGVSALYNTFQDCGSLPAYFESSEDSARHRVGMNTFDGGQPESTIVTRAPTSLTYGYNTSHRVGGNKYAIGDPNNSLADASGFTTD